MSCMTTYGYKGWRLVNVSSNYYCACKGNTRVPIGSIKRGNKAELTERFKQKVDQMEAENEQTDD